MFQDIPQRFYLIFLLKNVTSKGVAKQKQLAQWIWADSG
jgi:hypothetical protein